VTFNDHTGSTKSYLYTRKHMVSATEASFVPPATEILATISPQDVTAVTMHDGSVLRFRSVPDGYDPQDRAKVMTYLQERHQKGEILTGLLFVDELTPDLHQANQTTETPLSRVPFEKLCPGSAALDNLQEDFR
jgi:2-oxoglutarate ferredoxin oxidoreductase subunit beta